jgi:hypothetical protein
MTAVDYFQRLRTITVANGHELYQLDLQTFEDFGYVFFLLILSFCCNSSPQNPFKLPRDFNREVR